MRVGYVRGRRLTQQLDGLERQGVTEIFSDGPRSYEVLRDETSEYTQLFEFVEADDTIVLFSLEVISRDYKKLLLFITKLEEMELGLIVLNQPVITLAEWRQILQWHLQNERLLHPRVIKVGAEKDRNKNSYSLFSKDPEAKQLYRDIMWQLLEKKKIKQIAEAKGVPLESVYRIKQEFQRVKLAVILSLCFLLAIVMLKVAESFTDQFWLQVVVCVVATLVILYNTLIDSNEI